MKLIHRALFAVALLCGITAMGSWVLTQGDAAITKEEVPMILLIMSLSSVLFVLLHATSAFLANKGKGVRAIVTRTLFLMGLCGVVVVLFFVATSVGRIFLFGPLPTVLPLVSISCALLFRPNRIAAAA
jgi:fucose 4-O-acetylase-like acetyltransferase